MIKAKVAGTCSIREVARRAGVAPSTVSRVLSNRMGTLRVSAATRNRIVATARKLNYTPNVNALRLFGKRVGVIGLVAPSFHRMRAHIFADAHLTRIISGLEAMINDRRYNLLLLFCDEDFIRERRHLAIFRERRVDGLLVWGARENEPFWGELIESGWPHLFLTGLPAHSAKANYLASDYEQAGYLTTRHLLAQGHRRLGWLGGRADISPNRLLEAGMSRALGEFGLTMSAVTTATCNEYSRQSGMAATAAWLAQGAQFTALAAADHNLAAGALAALNVQQRHPRQISVACCDCPENLPGELADVPRVEVRDFALGQLAAATIFDLIDQPATTPIQVRLGVEFILPPRASDSESHPASGSPAP